MHISCGSGACYGALLRDLTLFTITHNLHCNHCAYTHEDTQRQCFLHVEPHFNAETSISLSLQETALPDWKCEACGKVGGRKQSALGDLPPFLLVHINKKAGFAADLASEARVRLSGKDLNRFAVVHHTGATPNSGHYTATVATQEMAYYCDDSRIAAQPDLFTSAWQNAYLIFLQNSGRSGDPHPAASTAFANGDINAQEQPSDAAIHTAGARCGDSHPATSTASASDDLRAQERSESEGDDDETHKAGKDDSEKTTMKKATVRLRSMSHAICKPWNAG